MTVFRLVGLPSLYLLLSLTFLGSPDLASYLANRVCGDLLGLGGMVGKFLSALCRMARKFLVVPCDVALIIS